MATAHNSSERALPTRPNCDISTSRLTLRKRGRRTNGQSSVKIPQLIPIDEPDRWEVLRARDGENPTRRKRKLTRLDYCQLLSLCDGQLVYRRSFKVVHGLNGPRCCPRSPRRVARRRGGRRTKSLGPRGARFDPDPLWRRHKLLDRLLRDWDVQRTQRFLLFQLGFVEWAFGCEQGFRQLRGEGPKVRQPARFAFLSRELLFAAAGGREL